MHDLLTATQHQYINASSCSYVCSWYLNKPSLNQHQKDKAKQDKTKRQILKDMKARLNKW